MREGPDDALTGRVTAVVVTLSIIVAAYVGFRIPSSWTATHDAVSVFDGFHRRVMVGTVLRPLAIATDYNYWLFAGFSYLVLAGVLAVMVVQAVRAELLSRRLLIVAWLLLPTGAFLFHEVGYFEQVLYLLLFGALALLHRDRPFAACAVIAIAPFVHEIAIVTVLPVFGLVALRTQPWRRAVIATAIPAALNVVVLAISAASDGAIEELSAALSSANFRFRTDALELFRRTQSENWGLFKPERVAHEVKPVVYGLVTAFACMWFLDRGLWRSRTAVSPVVGLLASCAAIGLPGLLVYGGWDGNRWLFLVISNFVLVVWLSLGDGRRHELRPAVAAVLVLALLIVARVRIYYFDPDSPRELGYHPVRKFIGKLNDGSMFELPRM